LKVELRRREREERAGVEDRQERKRVKSEEKKRVRERES